MQHRQHFGAEAAQFPAVYDELRRLARGYLARERAGHTLQATALVHEAIIRMQFPDDRTHPDRRLLIAEAARAMRNTLIDYARRRRAQKRGMGQGRVPLDDTLAPYEDRSIDLLELNDALDRLAELDPQLAQIVEFRFFGRLTNEETARALDVSPSTIVRGWRFARLWLHNDLTRGAEAHDA